MIKSECWRVPSRVWLGLPKVVVDDDDANNEDGNGEKVDSDDDDDTKAFAEAFAKMELVLLCGFADLPKDDQAKVIEHVKNKNNWARLTKRKSKNSNNNDDEAGTTGPGGGDDDNNVIPTVQKSSAVVPVTAISQRQKFIMPIPGKDGAIAGSLAGKTVVLTGIFPEGKLYNVFNVYVMSQKQ